MSSSAEAQIASFLVVIDMRKHVAQTVSGTPTSSSESDLVNLEGAIVQRVIELDTAKLSSQIAEHNPDRSWQEVDE